MDIILSIARLLFLLTGYFFRGGYQLVLGCLVLVVGMFICGGSVFIAAKGVPHLTEALGYGQKSPAEAASAVVDAAATLTTNPPTPTRVPTATIEPVDVAYNKLLGELDKVWEKDWPLSISLIKTFGTKYPNHSEARSKLYAALVSFGDELSRSGRASDAAVQYKDADGMIPGKEAHFKLLALTPTPAPPPPTATPVPPTKEPQEPTIGRQPEPPAVVSAPRVEPPPQAPRAAPPAPMVVRREPEFMGQVNFASLCDQLYPGYEHWNPGDSPNGWRCLLERSGRRDVKPITSDQMHAWCRKEYGDDVGAKLVNPNHVYGWQCWSR